MLNKSFYIVLAGAVMAVSGANAAGTQVQTVQSTDRAYESVENRLSTVTTQIGDIIDTTGAQKTDITGLLNNKQNRPDESCEEGKNCLLVKDAGGTEHWYPIIDCGEDSFLSGLNFDGANISFGPGEPWGWRLSSQNTLMCQNSAIGCQSGEWVTSYNKNSSAVGDNIVFGVMRRVAIAESTPGTIVTLPNNVQSGDVCVCKATKYKTWDASASRYGDGHDITTDKWLVIGNASDDENCMHLCADERNNSGGSKLAYYASIGNTCSAPAVEASMCLRHDFFVTASVTPPEHHGFVVSGEGANDCGQGGYFTGNSHCSENGAWIAEYEQNGILGYVYGTVGFASVPNGTTQYSVVDLNLSDLSTSGAGKNAVVCMVKGYKPASSTSETNVNLGKAFVVSVGDMSSVSGDGSGYSRTCGNAVAYTNDTGYSQAMSWYNILGNMCEAQ